MSDKSGDSTVPTSSRIVRLLSHKLDLEKVCEDDLAFRMNSGTRIGVGTLVSPF